ncbi:MAG: hypothetical protein P8Y69_05975, partial [Gammaproteobacteria bacterium]
ANDNMLDMPPACKRQAAGASAPNCEAHRKVKNPLIFKGIHFQQRTWSTHTEGCESAYCR